MMQWKPDVNEIGLEDVYDYKPISLHWLVFSDYKE